MTYVDFSREQRHGEPGGPGGQPTMRQWCGAPVGFVDRHPLKNDPDATPLIDPYAGYPGTYELPGTQYLTWYDCSY